MNPYISAILDGMKQERESANAEDGEANRLASDNMNKALDSFYYQEPRRYLYKSSCGFIPQDERHVKIRLKRMGFSNDDAEDIILKIEEDNYIPQVYDYQPARRAGAYRSESTRYIVLSDYPMPYMQGTQGQCDTILRYLKSLFGNDVIYFLAWLKGARRRILDFLNTGDYSTACQILAVMGDHDTGKTNILCKQIILPLLGGGSSVDYGAMLKYGKQFNGELMNGCLLVADDKGKPQGNDARRRMADTMKSIGYSGSFSIEAKGKTAISIRAPWAQLVLANDDDGGLESIPDFSGMEDKFIALHALRRSDFPPNSTEEERKQLDAAIGAEISAFAWYIDNYHVPTEIQEASGRHACKAYVAPSVKKLLQPLTEEARLMNAIDMLISDEYTIDKICTLDGISASTLQSELRRKNLWKDENGRALGRKLTRLCELYPGKIRKRTAHNNVKLYTISRPADAIGDED